MRRSRPGVKTGGRGARWSISVRGLAHAWPGGTPTSSTPLQRGDMRYRRQREVPGVASKFSYPCHPWLPVVSARLFAVLADNMMGEGMS